MGRKSGDSVNCRIGSLEIEEPDPERHDVVNCRIGSLEIGIHIQCPTNNVNCRIGSLEKMDSAIAVSNFQIHFRIKCRIASQGDAAFFYVAIEFAAPFRGMDWQQRTWYHFTQKNFTQKLFSQNILSKMFLVCSLQKKG